MGKLLVNPPKQLEVMEHMHDNPFKKCDYDAPRDHGDPLGAEAGNVGSDVDVAGYITRFLQLLYGSEARGHLVVWTKQNKKSFWYPVSALDEVGRKAAQMAQTCDVYFGIGLQDKRAVQDMQSKRSDGNSDLSRTRGCAETVISVPGLWLDIDVRGKAHAELNLPPAKEDAVELVREFPLAPSILVDSGHGLHGYWLFREPLTIDSKEERNEAQDLARRFQRTFQAMAAKRGWKIDNTSDLARVLRLPGTTNRKKEPVRVRMIEYHEERRYNPCDFEPYLVDDAARVDRCESRSARAPVRCLPRIEPIVAGCAWMRHCRDDAGRLPEPEWYAALSVLGRCQNGGDLAHEWSAPYPRYSRHETDMKLEHALKDAGPRSCRDIRSRFGESYCSVCPSWNKLTGPLALGTQAQAVSQEGPGLPSLQDEVMPFPMEILPLKLRRFVEEGARALPCPPDFLGLPLLAAVGTAVGASRVLRLKSDWTERPCIFGAIVGDPGSKKSPALKLAMKFIWERQKHLKKEYAKKKKKYELELAEYEQQRDQWKRNLKAGNASPQDCPEKPAKPVAEQTVVVDTTIEALVQVLHSNPRGVICIKDEFTSLVRAMNQYKAGKGDDQQHWLSLWNGSSIVINRRNLDEMITVENPFVSAIGCIPPDMLTDLEDPAHRKDGFMDRILFAYPNRIRNEWTDCEISPTTEREVEDAFNRLWNIPLPMREDGSFEPVELSFNVTARAKWIAWYNGHCREEESCELSEHLRNAWAKLSGYCARLALIIQMARWACGEASDGEIDETSVVSAITLVEYFKSHARRVHSKLHQNPQAKQDARAVAWIRKHGGRATPRDIQRAGVAGVKNVEQARELLQNLADRGYGMIEPQAERSFVFVLSRNYQPAE